MSIIAIILATQLTATAMVEETMLAQGADPTNVTVFEVDANHWFLNNDGPRPLARASRNAEGDEMIVIQRSLPKPYPMSQIIQHEVAHILAWREHGVDIRDHGHEFKRICKKVIKAGHQKEFCRKK